MDAFVAVITIVCAYILVLALTCEEDDIAYSIRLAGTILGSLVATYFTICTIGAVIWLAWRHA